MNNLVFLIPVALLLGGAGLAAFLWSLRDGQYDDLDGAAMRILLDEPGRPSIGHYDTGERPIGSPAADSRR